MSLQRLGRVVLLALAGAGLALVGAAGPASAHDRLVSTDPADGATVVVLPPALTLEFSEGVLATGTQVIVKTGGAAVDVPAPQVADSTVTVPLPADLANGDYDVAWRVVSADGHPVEGSFRFVLAVPGADPTTTPAASAPASDAPTDQASAVPAGGAAASPSPTATPAAVPGAPRGPIAVLVVALVAVAGVAGLVARRRFGMRGFGPPGQD